MGDKPIVTYAGDEKLFKSLEPFLLEGLPLEPVEWKRSYGRGPKAVSVEARFEAFDPGRLPREGDEARLLGQPFLHVYWTDCTDLEVYRSRVREDIIVWLAKLKDASVYDWMLVSVECPEPRRANKAKLLPRATVFDRMRADFPSKTSDRCCQLVDPQRSDWHSTDSWQGLLGRMRQLLLHACGRHLGRYEDLVRQQREQRTLLQWSFLRFFFLQEEFAFVLEMLGLHEEALVQYDELDALFTQFVINSASGGEHSHCLGAHYTLLRV
ncbi:trafficking protein particle complex subunit 10-like, partial [Ixodes scapularis]|uniref:trafficking protein particle complex subunit 10-like n=1 Tax=Ixodes scapularis TaxID=6945 RepID=UPI001C380781